MAWKLRECNKTLEKPGSKVLILTPLCFVQLSQNQYFTSGLFLEAYFSQRLKSQIWLIYLFGSVPLNSSKKSRTISRVMSWMIICLILLLPAASSDPPENNPGQIIVLHSVLLRVRFTWHSLLPENRWALTPPFHPYWHKPAVYLCCTIFGVTSTGRYPAPCPVKPGLSSSQTLR